MAVDDGSRHCVCGAGRVSAALPAKEERRSAGCKEARSHAALCHHRLNYRGSGAADCRKQRQRLSGGCKLLPRVGQHAAERRPGEFLPNDKLLRLSARVCLHHGLERGADAGSAPVRGCGAQAHPDGVRFGGGGAYLPYCAQEERQCQSGGHFDAADGVQPRRFPQQRGLVPD